MNLLFDEQQLEILKKNERLHYPEKIIVRGRKSTYDTAVAVYVCTDTFYFNDYDKSNSGIFEVSCKLGRGGIAAFVDKYGDLQTKNRFLLGGKFGGVGAIVAVEFKNSQPICRSRYVVGVRQGIRYPDDVWLSKRTNKPITSEGNSDISNSRFIFQSRQPNGSSTDIFVADFDGANMCNLTKKNETAYDRFFDEDGSEVAEWVDKKIIRYCSVRGGKREIIEKPDCSKS